MPAEKGAFYTNLLQAIEKGLGKVELDRGGYWSKDYSIWVDRRFSEFIGSPLLSSEKKYIEALGSMGLSVGRLFNRQLHDANNGVMWPTEIFGEDGAEKLLSASVTNPSILSPFSLLSGGLDSPSVPYSIAYADELAKLDQQLHKALELEDSPSAKAHVKYLSSLIKAYTLDPKRTDDTKYMEAADKDWVNIPPNAPLLIFVEPTEVYHDPARVALGQKPEVAKLANKVTDENGLGLWRPFFEFRLLVNDESMVKKEEIDVIRKTSRKLYATQSNVEVPVSLEFRRLLLASGNGAHPAKTAKNYPNFEQIRDKDGYKNVLYTNMIEEGTLTQLIPTLRKVFDEKIVNQFSEQQLVRGTSLRVVAHEENHPFKRFRDTPLEELKASVNGIKAIIESGQFNDEDINAVLLTEIGAALYGRSKMVEARMHSDANTQTGLEGYYKGDTIFMNYLIENGGLVINDKGQVVEVDFKLLKENSIKFADYLEKVREGEQQITIPKIYEDFNNEKVWDNFSVLNISEV